jgi:hypothetical protein
VKIVGKKNVATLKAGSKVVFAPPSSKAMPKAAAQKTVVPKSVPPVALSTVSGAGVMKVVTAGRYGAQGTMKARVLKIKARQRKATSTEPSLVPVAKKERLFKLRHLLPPRLTKLWPLCRLRADQMMTEWRLVQCFVWCIHRRLPPLRQVRCQPQRMSQLHRCQFPI